MILMKRFVTNVGEGTDCSGHGKGKFQVTVQCWVQDTGTTVYADVFVHRPSGSGTKGTFKGTVTINGTARSIDKYITGLDSSYQMIASEKVTGISGSSCTVSVTVYGPVGTSLDGATCSGSGSCSLTYSSPSKPSWAI